MYNLILRKDSQVRVALYSPENSTLIWKDTNESLLELKKHQEVKQEIFRVAKNKPGSKSQHVTTLKIQLGFACNFSCSYCSQGDIRKNEAKSLSKSDLAELENLFSKIVSNLEIKNSKDVQIEFWGGETLLYWEEVKYLTKKLREKFSSITLLLFTNGSLIKSEMAEFSILNQLQFVFSHDGPAFKKFRGKDPLEDNKSLSEIIPFFNRMNEHNLISFNSAINPENYSLLEIRKHIASKLNVELNKIVVNYDLVIPYSDSALSYVRKDSEDKLLVNKLFKEYITQYPFNLKLGRLDQQLHDFYEAITEKKILNSFYQKCSMDSPDSLAINLKGEVITCQNVTADSGHKIGNLDDLKNVKLNTATHFSNREECQKCPVVQVCKGSCMFLEGNLWEKSCDQHFTWSLAFLKFAIFLQTGYELTSIEGQNIRNRKVDNINLLEG